MNQEFTRRLIATFPWLYHGREDSVRTNLLPFGFECGDGWFTLIKRLSADLTSLAEAEGRTREEWPKAIQVKEKFGTLSFYASGLNDAMQERVSQATGESAQVCKTCGQPGRFRDSAGWLSTRCGFHASSTFSLSWRAASCLKRLSRFVETETGTGDPEGSTNFFPGEGFEEVLEPRALAFFDTRPREDPQRQEFADLRRLLGSRGLETRIEELRAGRKYRDMAEVLRREAVEGYDE